MIVRYNSLNRFEHPSLTLCNPGSVYNNGVLTNMVGILADVSDDEIVFNFNATSELNFRITKLAREDSEETQYAYKMYNAVKNRRLIFIEDIGYFMITNVSDGFDGTSQYKDVKAESIDVEIAQKMIPFIADDTYRFSTDSASDTTGLFDTIAATLPLWTIGTVDSSVASKYRTFEDVDTSTNCLGFFLQNMQDAYECIFVFDIIHRIINVYSQDNYVVDTSIHITKDDLINSIEVREDAVDLYTAISVRGDDESVTIGSVNPLGTNTIYDFHYYLSWMSSGLRAKVSAWQNAIDAAKTAYYNNNLAYYTNLATAANYELELQKLQTQITMYTRCRENIVASGSTGIVPSYNTVIVENGGTAITISAEISVTLSTIDSLVSDCKSDYAQTQNLLTNLNSVIATYRTAIQATVNALSMSSYFTASELEELNHYIFEGSYTDEYVTITDDMSYTKQFEQMKLLYDRASARLERVSEPTQEFDIDTENFIFAKDFEHWSDELETGCLINVELGDGDIALLFLSTITINYDDMSLKLTFGNKFNKFDAKSLFDNMLGDISKSANTLSYLKEILYPIKSGEFNAMQEALQASRDLTMAAALASTNEEVVIDGSGYTGKQLLPNGEYDPRQIKITGKSIVFTDDAWETCKTAVGEIILGNNSSVYGVNGEAILGKLIVGNNLHILDNEGNDVLTVMSDSINAKVSETDYNGNTIVGKINLNSTTATISASRINLVGAVTMTSLASDVSGKLGRIDEWASSLDSTYIDGAKIYTGSIMVDTIRLYGAMSVYTDSTLQSLGGTLGYMSGSHGFIDGSSETTNGMALVSQNRTHYLIVTNAGVRMTEDYNGAVYRAYLADGQFRVDAMLRALRGGHIQGNAYLNATLAADGVNYAYSGTTNVNNLHVNSALRLYNSPGVVASIEWYGDNQGSRLLLMAPDRTYVVFDASYGTYIRISNGEHDLKWKKTDDIDLSALKETTPVLVMENSSPTQGFAEQTTTYAGLSGYNMLYIETQFSTSSTDRSMTQVYLPDTSATVTVCLSVKYYAGNNNIQEALRFCDINRGAETLHFWNGSYTTNGSSLSWSDNHAIPVHIFGAKI